MSSQQKLKPYWLLMPACIIVFFLIRGCHQNPTYDRTTPNMQVLDDHTDTTRMETKAIKSVKARKVKPSYHVASRSVLDTTFNTDHGSISLHIEHDSTDDLFKNIEITAVQTYEQLRINHELHTLATIPVADRSTSAWTWVEVGSAIGVLITLIAGFVLHIL